MKVPVSLDNHTDPDHPVLIFVSLVNQNLIYFNLLLITSEAEILLSKQVFFRFVCSPAAEMNVRESQHNFQFNICYAPLVCFAVNRFSSLQDSGRLGETVSLCSSRPQSPAFFQVPGHVYRPVWVACKCTGSERRAAGPAG